MSQSNRAGPHGSRCSNCQNHGHLIHTITTVVADSGRERLDDHHIFYCFKFRMKVPAATKSCSGYAISKKHHIYCQRCLKYCLAPEEGQRLEEEKHGEEPQT